MWTRRPTASWAAPLDALDQPIAPGEALSHAEIDARYGWLVLTQIDDMTAAVQRGDHGAARAIAADTRRELALLHTLQRDPSSDAQPAVVRADRALIERILGRALSSTEARLADANTALQGDDLPAARAILDGAGDALKPALIELDLQVHAQRQPGRTIGTLP